MKLARIAAAVIAVSVSLSSISGCRSAKQDESELMDKIPESALKKLPEAERLKLAQPIIESICEGLKNNDYEAYTRDFYSGFKDQVTKKEFDKFTSKMKEDLGDYESKQYIGMVNKELFDIFYWKCTFSKRKEKDENIMRLFLIDEDGKYKVYLFHVYPW